MISFHVSTTHLKYFWSETNHSRFYPDIKCVRSDFPHFISVLFFIFRVRFPNRPIISSKRDAVDGRQHIIITTPTLLSFDSPSSENTNGAARGTVACWTGPIRVFPPWCTPRRRPEWWCPSSGFLSRTVHRYLSAQPTLPVERSNWVSRRVVKNKNHQHREQNMRGFFFFFWN